MSNITITTEPDQSEWDALIHAAFMPALNQTWEWGEAMSTIKGVRPIRLMAKEGDTAVGVLQAFEWKIGPVSMAIISGESGDGGGPVVAGDSSVARELLSALFAEAKKRKSLKVTVYGSVELGDALKPIAGVNTATKWTPVVPLSETREKMLHENVAQKTRNQITKSEKNGIRVYRGEHGDLKTYRAIQSQLVQKKYLNGQHLNTLASLQHVWDELSPSDMIKLYLAEKEGKVVGGALILYAGKGLVYRSGVLTEEGRDLYAGNAIQWQVIKDAIREGRSVYNMCGGTVDESDPMYGITKFKLSFGGEMKSFVRYSAHGNRVLRFLMYRIRRIFGKNEWFPLLIYP